MEQFELDWMKRWNLYSPDRIALKDGWTGQHLTYKDCYEIANQVACGLRDRYCITKGDRVAVLAGNSLEYILLFFALQRLGAVMVPINYRLASREVGHILGDSGPKVIFADQEMEPLLDQVDPALCPEHREPLSFASGLFRQAVQAQENSRIEFCNFAAAPEDYAMILYTSGTTGLPKGALLSHRMIFWNSINTGLRLNLSQSDKTVIFLPLFHTGGWNVLTTPFLHRGAEIILLPKFDAEKVLQLSCSEGATILFGVPTTMNLMSQAPDFKTADLSSLRYAIVGGEPMPRSLIETWHSKGVPVRQGYGLTEFGPNVFSLNEEDAIRKIGSIGFANFYIDTKIVNDRGEEVPPGEIGELVLSGPCCMSGYWNNEEATAQTIKEGWLYTGDLVTRDEEGYYYVAGRKKEMYISGGENVYPAEVEQVLHGLPQVREAAVVGIQDSTWGEVGRAFIALNPQQPPLSEAELEAYCRKNLAKFKVPKSFHFLNELPKGDSGKILKRKLLEL